MASVIQNIQVIRSLRKDLRDQKLPINILKSVETIHNCIRNGTDLNGWKKVDWRNSGNSNSGRSSNSSGQGNKGGFFGNRQQNQRDTRDSRDYRDTRDTRDTRDYRDTRDTRDTSSQYVFGSKSRSGFTGRQSSESQISIPLTGSTSPLSENTTPINTVVNPPQQSHISSDGFRVPPQKYVSKFKKNCDKVEDTILNTIILGKLNKFSEQNYDEIKEFITHIIDSGQTDMIKCFMKLVFQKAASEEMFCPLYAKLLSELSARYPVLLTEMANLYAEYMEIFEEVYENSAENYNEICRRNVEKKYRRGYSQFLAELIKHDVIDTDTFMKIITKILNQVENNIKNNESIKLNEEYADCFMKIMKAIQSSSEDNESDAYSISSDESEEKESKIESIRETLKGEPLKRIQPFTIKNTDFTGMSTKARFTFLDIYEGIQKF
jgi:hypothetical protein